MKIITIALVAIFVLMTNNFAHADVAKIFVDNNAQKESADGSENNPYTTLGKAFEAAREKNGKAKIIISSGIYKGKFVVPKDVEITGKGSGKTIIQGDGGTTLFLSGNNKIKGLSILGGSKGIVIAKNATATIDSCSVKKTKSIGIETQASTKMPSKKILITNSNISNNSGKGLYIQKTEVSIIGNNIKNNQQEGIDIRQGVSGTLKNNTAVSNKESGIELIVGKSNLQIIDNKINNNKASGISTQYYKNYNDIGSIMISNNKVTGNEKFAIDCSVPQGAGYGPNYWSDSISQEKNLFQTNNIATFGERCSNLEKKMSPKQSNQNQKSYSQAKPTL